MIQFVREAAAEVSRIAWPSRREVVGLTVLVLIVSAIVAAYLGALDSAFTWLVERAVIGGY
jgi:preprotein translocase subunit SecE